MEDKLNVFIVDDEYLIRNLIKMKVNWEKVNMEVIGECGNAEDALNMLDELKPDIIFTDICMPSMNGIEFSKVIKDKHPNTKIVVVTGYDDFNYARDSVRIGVSDYILKPINSDEIMEVLERVKGEILAYRKHEEELYILKKQIEILPKITSSINESREEITKLMENTNEIKVNNIIEGVKKYLSDNISKQELSLKNVANKFYISPGHLGRLFKQNTSMTFVEYLTSIRIEKIKKLLLETDFKGAKICEECGISDPHYLSILFKKQTGMSINEFKKIK